MDKESAIGDADNRHARKSLNVVDDLLAVCDRGRVNGDVANDMILVDLDDVNRTDVAARAADRRGDLTDHTHLVFQPNPNRDAIRRAQLSGAGLVGRFLLHYRRHYLDLLENLITMA